MLSTLSINADDVVEDRRRIALCSVFSGRTAYSTPRAPDGCVDGCVKYVDAHVKDYRLSLTQSVIFFPRKCRKVRNSVLELRVGCPSCNLPRDTWIADHQGASDKSYKRPRRWR